MVDVKRLNKSRHVHRRRAALRDEPTASAHSRSISACNRRGEMHFFLQRVAGGLYVEREDNPGLGLQTVQSLQFTAAADFRDWCDNDPVRFEHPLLHVDLKRQGDELWRLDAPPSEFDGD